MVESGRQWKFTPADEDSPTCSSFVRLSAKSGRFVRSGRSGTRQRVAERATGLGVRLPTLRSALPAKSCSDGQYGRSFLAPDGLRVTAHL